MIIRRISSPVVGPVKIKYSLICNLRAISRPKTWFNVKISYGYRKREKKIVPWMVLLIGLFFNIRTH